MRNSVVKRLLLVVMCVVGVLALPAMAMADVEPNNGITQAEGPLAGGVTYTGAVANSTDLDTYFFYVSGQQQLDLKVTGLTASGECLAAFFGDTDNYGLASKSYIHEGQSYDFLYTTPPGVNRYYLEFNSGCTGETKYSFTINPAAAIVGGVPTLIPNPTTEPNENGDQAFGPLLGGVAYAGEIQTQNDQDWFKFYTAPGVHQFDVAFTRVSGCELSVELQSPIRYGNQSTYLSEDQWKHFTQTSPGQGVYYLKFAGGCVGSRYEFVIQPPEALYQTPPPASPPAPAAPLAPPPPPKVHRGYAIANPSAKVDRGEAYLELTCAGAGDCSGTVNLVARANGRSDAKVSIGGGSFALAKGTSTTLPVAVSRLGMGMLHLSPTGQLHVHLSGHDLKGGSLLLRTTRHRRKRHRNHPRRHHRRHH